MTWAIPAFAVFLGAATRASGLWRWRPSGSPSSDGTSTVETAFLRMTLDHRSGRMDGEIRSGRFAGRFLSELGLAELMALLAACDDFDSRRLIETFLDRAHPDWRRVDAGGAKFIDHNRGATAFGRLQEMLHQCGLAGAEKAGHHRHRNPGAARVFQTAAERTGVSG